MANLFELYATVRVKQLLQPAHLYDGWQVNQRPPAVGDYGTVLDVLTATGYPNKFIVECTASDGTAIWLGEFWAEELEVALTPLR